MNILPAIDFDGSLDACWRRIGVAGDRSCAELARHIHCRNCGVYSSAAQRNLQRAVEPGYREAWARELARPELPAPATDSAAMVFRVGAEWLAVPVALVDSVAPHARAHRIPHRANSALLGVVNVAGRVLPAVSLAQLLGIADEHAAPLLGRHAFERLLVLLLGGQRVAVPVAEMHGMLRYAKAAVRPAAATVGHAPHPLVAGVIGDSDIDAGLLDGAELERQVQGLLR